jgi:glycosyltransferase involved in cell wall biosynthesis
MERSEAMGRTFRLAVVNSHPIQYFAPLYRFLNRGQGLEVTALYCSDFSLRGSIDPGFKQTVTWDVDLLSGYRSVFLGDAARTRTLGGFWSLVCPQVWPELRSGSYDAVLLHGYSHAVEILALLAAKSKGLPVFMRSETHLGLHRQKWKRWVRDSVLSVGYRFVDGFLAIGSANRAYYRALGVPDSKIFDVPYTVDNERFISAAALTPEQRLEVRKKYGVPAGKPVVLYASKFMRRKHPDDVIRAVASLEKKGEGVTLLMVGTGEMEQELRAQAAALGMDNVVFAGFINQSELPSIYAASDIFVLPAEDEPWGLIVNEVMCAGVPVVAADEVGCVRDLVQDGVNGYHMKAGDVGSLAKALQTLVGDEPLRRRMGAASLSIIRGWSYEQCRQGITAALSQVAA